MAKTSRQTAIFGVEDWRKLYETFREADFQSYDFETLRKSFVDYLRLYYPETFNDYIESSEFIALLDVMAFMGQALAFRNDLNTRENFLDTAERRDSVVKLANLISYTPKRNQAAEGFLKVFSARTTEDIVDFNGINLANVTVNWNDPTNPNWLEQFTYIINSSLVDSQKFGRPGNSQSILGNRTDEYTINLVPGFIPTIPYTVSVDGITMPFEAVSATTQGKSFVYEPAPQPNGAFNVLYRNDQLGFGSNNTGFFFLFKQGILQNQEFNLSEAVTNRTVNINIEGINNQDHWLYKIDDTGNISDEWEFVESIYAGAAEQSSPDQRKYYSITSRANDQVTLTFGDGVFAEIPVGLFRAYVRASNGLSYIINPEEMQSVQIEIGYVSRVGRVETITMTCGITQPVSNAQPRETIDEIKQRAPARYYTQNRMVNGEDYNNFPFTKYNNIVKSKAIARSAIGTSRYTDLTDITAKYSSTNIFAADGLLYRENISPTFDFEWTNQNDIVNVITNRVEPVLTSRSMLHFYYANYVRPDLAVLQLAWSQSTTLTNETTGYFYLQANAAAVVPVGAAASNAARFVQPGSLVKFTAPVGQYFDKNNRLRPGTPAQADEKLDIWATVIALVSDGTNAGLGNLDNGTGPVTLNDFVPTGAVPTQVIPKFINDLPPTLEQQILQQIGLFRNFGLGYDNVASAWYLISSTNLDATGDFSLVNSKNTQGVNLDASWLIEFVTDGAAYTVKSRGLDYVFASVIETRFFFNGVQKVYDNKTGQTINDFINVLKSNSRPGSNESLPGDVVMEIVDQPVESDGFVNDYRVMVSYTDSDSDGVADNPDFFDDIVASGTNTATKNVFLQLTTDFNNIENYLPVPAGTVNDSYTTRSNIELAKNEFVNGQVLFATQDQEFYSLQVEFVNGVLVRTLLPRNDFIARTGRQSLYFQYRHNSPLTNVIDPGVTNIIDLYVAIQAYYTAYQNYVKDNTGTVPEPQQPTIDQLSAAYSGLNEFKMISDNIVLNSVTFKPLFGAKAAPELRAMIKVIRAPKTTASDSEIKSQVVANLNSYFTIDKWDFGSSFFFSELSAFLHSRMGSLISSVVLVPLNPLRSFGDLYEVRSAANEIFVSAVTVDDVEVIDALTQSAINSQRPVSGLQPGPVRRTPTGTTAADAPMSAPATGGGGATPVYTPPSSGGGTISYTPPSSGGGGFGGGGY